MSADNGIYILKTPNEDGSGFEFRVTHSQSIENIYNIYPEVDPDGLIAYFGHCKVLTEDEAHKKAFEMENEILNDSYCPILEYGISTISLPHYFTWYFKPFMKNSS